jgi:hypothetical protein
VSEESDDNQNVALSLPVPVVAAGLAAGLAVAAYVLLGRSNAAVEPVDKATKATKATKKFGRKLGLTTLITLIENDTTRKVVVAVLRAVARRS